MNGKLLEVRNENNERFWLEVEKKEISLKQELAHLYSFRDFSAIVNANSAARDKDLTIAMSSHELKTPL